MTAAASKYTATAPPARTAAGKISGVSVATMLYAQATPVPMAMSVNMFKLRVSSDCQPRTKNDQPAQSTTGVARIIWIQFEVVGLTW